MKSEFEIKILDIEQTDLANKIVSNGGTNNEEVLQKIKVYTKEGWETTRFIRVRQSGSNPVELTYKNVTGDEIGDIKELELIVDSFENSSSLLEVTGFTLKQYLEKKRTKFMLGECEILIDTIPLYPPYAEIEGPTKDSVIDCANSLGIDYNDQLHEETVIEMKRRLADLEKYQVYTFEKQVKHDI